MATSHVIARVSHGRPVAFLALSKTNGASWRKDSASAYRFRTVAEATYFLSTLPECGAVILAATGVPTADRQPSRPRGKPSPAPTPRPTLAPITYSTGEKIGLTVGALVVVLFAIALVMGW
jgi:hypothetical protein